MNEENPIKTIKKTLVRFFLGGALAEPVITFFSIVSIFNSRYDMNTVESALES